MLDVAGKVVDPFEIVPLELLLIFARVVPRVSAAVAFPTAKPAACNPARMLWITFNTHRSNMN